MGGEIVVIQGDITTQAVDSIVNAANEALLGGGGVDGAIHRAAGPELLAACRAIGGCPTGEARITCRFRLPARYVIHTVGPVWRGGNAGEDLFLAACHRRALELARAHELKSIAFPAISTGAYGFPIERAARIAIGTVADEIDRSGGIESVRFVCFGPEPMEIFRRAWHAISRI